MRRACGPVGEEQRHAGSSSDGCWRLHRGLALRLGTAAGCTAPRIAQRAFARRLRIARCPASGRAAAHPSVRHHHGQLQRRHLWRPLPHRCQGHQSVHPAPAALATRRSAKPPHAPACLPAFQPACLPACPAERAPSVPSALLVSAAGVDAFAVQHMRAVPPAHSPTPPPSTPSHLHSLPAGRIFHADNSGFLPGFFVTFQNVRFTGGSAPLLGGAFFNQGRMQVGGSTPHCACGRAPPPVCTCCARCARCASRSARSAPPAGRQACTCMGGAATPRSYRWRRLAPDPSRLLAAKWRPCRGQSPLLRRTPSRQVEFDNCDFVSNTAQAGAGAVSLAVRTGRHPPCGTMPHEVPRSLRHAAQAAPLPGFGPLVWDARSAALPPASLACRAPASAVDKLSCVAAPPSRTVRLACSTT